MPRSKSSRLNDAAPEPIRDARKFTEQQGLDLWREAAKRVEGSRDRMLEAEDITLGRIQLAPPKHLLRSQGDQIKYLIPRLAARKKIPLNMTNDLIAQRPVVERRRPPKGGATIEARAEETETALNALELELFPWEESCGRSAQKGEFGIVTLLAEDAWDASPEYDDVLTEDEWKKLPKKEQQTYRRAEMEGGKADYKRPKAVYWRDKDGKGVEDDDYGRRDPKQTRKAYDDALEDHLACHPPFVIRGYSPLDYAPTWDGNELVALSIRQLMEPSDLLERGYRCKALDRDENGKARVMVPRGFDGALFGKGNKVYLYQHFVWIDGDPCLAVMVGGQETDRVQNDGTLIEAVTNLREKWGFTRLPVGVYEGQHLETDNRDDRPVPCMEPIGEMLVALEGSIGSMNITSWRQGTSKYTVHPLPHVPPAAYLDGANNLKQVDLDPDSDIVTTIGPIGSLAPIEHSGDTRYVQQFLKGELMEAVPSPAASGGEGSSSGREAALLHTYAQQANSMPREGLRRAVEDSASFLLEWACCLMRTKKLAQIPMYANVETDPGEGEDEKGEKTVLVRLREDWIGKNYKVSAKYPQVYNPVMAEQAVDFYERGVYTFEDVMDATGKTNALRQRVKIVNDLYWRSERGQMELAAIDARQRGDVERARQYEMWLAGQATPLAVGPDGKPIEMGPSAALDDMFQQGQDGGGMATQAQAGLAGTIGAGRGAEMADAAMTAGMQGSVQAGAGMM